MPMAATPLTSIDSITASAWGRWLPSTLGRSGRGMATAAKGPTRRPTSSSPSFCTVSVPDSGQLAPCITR